MIHIGKTVERVDLDEFLKAINQAQAAAPMLDPTLYRKASRNLDAIKKLATIMKTYQVAFRETFDAMVKTAIENHQDGPEGIPV